MACLCFYSASGASEVMFQNRIIQVILGFTVMMIMAQLPPKFYQRLAPYLYLVGFIMLILVDAIGTTSKGATTLVRSWVYSLSAFWKL